MKKFIPALFIALPLLSCGEPEEATRVSLPVTVDSSGVQPITTDLGYEVRLTTARVMIEDLQFAIAGEAHTSLWRQLSELVLPTAYAHPGHFSGGDVTGELPGRFQLNWTDSAAPLGTATLLVGDYQSANFTFIRGTEADGLTADDPLLGHTALLQGVATKGDSQVAFTVLIDSPEGRVLTGAPFQFDLDGDSDAQLGLRLLTQDPYEDDTLMDGVDFSALDTDGDGQLQIGPDAAETATQDAYNQLRRTFQTHDHFDVQASQPD